MKLPLRFFATWTLLIFALITFDAVKLARLANRIAYRMEVSLCQ